MCFVKFLILINTLKKQRQVCFRDSCVPICDSSLDIDYFWVSMSLDGLNVIIYESLLNVAMSTIITRSIMIYPLGT